MRCLYAFWSTAVDNLNGKNTTTQCFANCAVV